MTLTGQKYTCSAGETFDIAAQRIFGDEKYACELLNANPALCLIPIFTGGEELDIPEIEMPSEEAEESYMPAKAPWKE